MKIFLIDEKYFHASVLEVARGLCDHYVYAKCVEFRGVSSVHTSSVATLLVEYSCKRIV